MTTNLDRFNIVGDLTHTDTAGTIGVVGSQVLGVSTNRVCIIIQNMSNNRIIIYPELVPTLTFGFEIIQANGPVIFSMRDFGTIIGRNWLAISDMAASPFTILECILANQQ